MPVSWACFRSFHLSETKSNALKSGIGNLSRPSSSALCSAAMWVVTSVIGISTSICPRRARSRRNSQNR